MINSSFEFYHIFLFNGNVFLLYGIQFYVLYAFLLIFFSLICKNCLYWYIKDINIFSTKLLRYLYYTDMVVGSIEIKLIANKSRIC